MNKRLLLPVLCLLLLFAPVLCRAETAVGKLENGASSPELKMVQQELIAQNILRGKADGVFGPKTREALNLWCRKANVSPQNITLLGVLVRMQKADPASAEPANDSLAVYISQRTLERWGFFTGKIDSTYGGETEKALNELLKFAGSDWRTFRNNREHSLGRLLGKEADAAREAADTKLGVERESSEPESEDEPLLNADTYAFLLSGYAPIGDEVKSGDDSDDALRVQNRLHTLKYLYNGMDGKFGGNSVRALKYFQKKNDLEATGICDETTWKALYSEFVVESDKFVAPYMAKVSTSECRVRIYAWDGDGYNEKVKEFVCTTGARSTPTIKGTFQSGGQLGSWYYIKKSKIWVRYAFQIKGNYLFHSVLYKSKGAKKPTSSSVNNLGRNVSHGCVRLSVSDSKWIYDNCTKGMTVVIE